MNALIDAAVLYAPATEAYLMTADTRIRAGVRIATELLGLPCPMAAADGRKYRKAAASARKNGNRIDPSAVPPRLNSPSIRLRAAYEGARA